MISPEVEWRTISLLDAVDLIMDFRGRTPKKLGLEWGGGKIRAISARNVRDGFVDFSVDHYLASEVLYRRWMSYGHMQSGDILLTTEAPLGNVAPVPDGDKYILSQRTILLRPSRNKVDSLYLTKYLQSPKFQRLLFENATGSTALGIQRKRLETLPVTVPPFEEQRRIGAVLYEVDDFISSLKRLISKKQAIKQGMMQELLSGKTRLPGFQESWVQTKIGKLASVVGGGTPSTKTPSYWNGDIPWFTPGEISKNGSGLVKSSERSITSEGLQRSGAKLLPANSILVTSRASLGHCAVAEVPVATNQGFTSLVPKDSQSSWFLYYWMQHNRHELQTRAAGSTFLEISSAKVESIPITIPSIREQEAIAEVLRDADNEINALNRRLESVRSIKQGMMQELLTGRTRLPIEEVSS